MSYAYRKRKKLRRRGQDTAEPERKEVRNAIRKGKAPRLVTLLNPETRKTYRRKFRKDGWFYKRIGYRYTKQIKFATHIIFQPKIKKTLIERAKAAMGMKA